MQGSFLLPACLPVASITANACRRSKSLTWNFDQESDRCNARPPQAQRPRGPGAPQGGQAEGGGRQHVVPRKQQRVLPAAPERPSAPAAPRRRCCLGSSRRRCWRGAQSGGTTPSRWRSPPSCWSSTPRSAQAPLPEELRVFSLWTSSISLGWSGFTGKHFRGQLLHQVLCEAAVPQTQCGIAFACPAGLHGVELPARGPAAGAGGGRCALGLLGGPLPRPRCGALRQHCCDHKRRPA